MSGDGVVSGDAVVAELAQTWASIDALLAGLAPDEWPRATACPGWTVRDQVAHLIGTESMLAGRRAPQASGEPGPHVKNDIGRLNEAWIDHYRSSSPDDLLGAYREITGERLGQLRAMTDSDFEADSWTPIGPATYGRFMEIRVFDTWVHEQDIRDAVGRSGHEEGPVAERAMAEIVGVLGYTVGKRARAPDGARVTIELTGPVHRVIHVAVVGRARVVPELDGPATATVSLASSTFARLACGRVDPGSEVAAGRVALVGDRTLAERVVANLAFTI